MATVGQQLTAPEPGWKRYDDSHPAFNYYGTWPLESNFVYYNSTAHYSRTVGDTATFKFKGTKIRLITDRNTNRAVNSQYIIIDGIKELVNTYGTTQGQILTYEKTGLEDTIHTVEIGVEIDLAVIDAIDIDDTGRIFHPNEVTDPKELAVGKRIRCHYTASSGTVGTFSGLGQETSDFIPATSSATPNGDFYLICVDNERWNTRWKLIADRNIQHSISWDTLNSAGIASGSGLPLNYDLKNPLVAGWKFDEVSGGTVYDVAKRYNGTVTGTTIVTGWDNNGKARSFNGTSDYITFNNTIIPLGKKSIRFKFKKSSAPSDTQVIISNGYWATNIYGTYVYVRGTNVSSSGEITFVVAKSATSVAGVNTGVNVCDGNWHDILFTWTGDATTDGVKAYVDGVLTSTSTAISTETNNPSFNMHIGSYPDKNFKFNGELDQFEIYADVIEPNSTLITNEALFSVRLSTGGISSIDNNNEWDQYIVNSTLNGTIIAGDNNVWNWSSIFTMTSTTAVGVDNGQTPTAAARTIRGSSSVNRYSWGNTNNVYSSYGFRPVFIIENQENTKYLFQEGSDIKVWNGTMWVTVGQTPVTMDLFNNNGMNNISILTRTNKKMIYSMTDNGTLGSGHTWKHTLDLSKLIEITKITPKGK